MSPSRRVTPDCRYVSWAYLLTLLLIQKRTHDKDRRLLSRDRIIGAKRGGLASAGNLPQIHDIDVIGKSAGGSHVGECAGSQPRKISGPGSPHAGEPRADVRLFGLRILPRRPQSAGDGVHGSSEIV